MLHVTWIAKIVHVLKWKLRSFKDHVTFYFHVTKTPDESIGINIHRDERSSLSALLIPPFSYPGAVYINYYLDQILFFMDILHLRVCADPLLCLSCQVHDLPMTYIQVQIQINVHNNIRH